MQKNNSGGLRAIDFFMLGFGSMIGVGWTVAISDWFQAGGGPLATLLAFFVGTLAVIPIGLCYGEMTGSMPVSGGIIAFAYRSGGTRLSFLGGWLVALAYVVLLPWEAIYVNKVLTLFFPALVSGEPLYEFWGHSVYPAALTVGIGLTLLLVLINLRGAEMFGKLQTHLTFLILICASIVFLFSILKARTSNLFPIYSPMEGYDHRNFFSGFISVLVVVPFFLAGFDAIPQAVEDADDTLKPRRISRTIVLTIAGAGLFYLFIILSSALAMPWKEFSTLEAPAVALMFHKIYDPPIGNILYYLTLFGALAGLLSTWNGMFVAASKLLFSMGRAKLIPNIFSKEGKRETPIFSILFCGLAAVVGPIFGPAIIRPLTNVGSVAFVMGWFITVYSTWKLRNTEPNLPRPIRAGEGMGLIYISILVSGILILLSVIPGSPGFMGFGSLSILCLWILIGGVFFYISQTFGNTISEKKRHRLMFKNSLNKQ